MAQDETQALWREYVKSKDQGVRDRLILTYAPLVKYVAGRLGSGLPAHVDENDLVSYGLLGLIGAIERFDPNRDIKFETYAIARIKGSIIDELRAMDWVPRSVRSRARDIERAIAELERKLHRAPTDEEIAEKLGITTDELDDSLSEIGRSSIAALDELWTISSSGGDQVALIDTIEDTQGPEPQSELAQTELKEALGEAIARLPEREKLVVTLYYYEELTLREIGEVLGVTESRVSQLHTKAILRLKARLAGSPAREPLGREPAAEFRNYANRHPFSRNRREDPPMKLRGSVAALTAVAILLVLTACGGSSSSSSSGGGSGKSLSASDAQNPKGNVSWCIGKDTTGAFAAMVKQFNAANPNAKVKLIELPTSADQQRAQQVQRLRAKSSECDILGIDPIWMAEYVSQGWLYDLTDALSPRKSDFIGSTVESATYQGKQWAFPFNTNAGFLYYRTDKVKSAPKTWQDVYADAKQDGGLVYQGASYEGLTVNFLELLYTAGGKAISDDGKKATIDSPEAKEVLTFMQNGVKDGAVSHSVSTYMEEESRRAFEAGKAALMRQWPYAYALGEKSPIKGKFAIETLPGWNDKPASGVIGGYNLAVNAYSKNPGTALAFAEFVTQPKQQEYMAAKTTLPPTLSEAYDAPAVKKVMPFASELRKAVEQAHPRPLSPVYPQISEAIYKNVYNALWNGASVDSALKKANDQINQALKQF